jgi:MFS family permease
VLLYTSSFIDRLIISLLVEPIQADLLISDTLMGLLTGTAFAALYTVMGMPFGRLADNYRRRSIIAAGAGVWSIMTMLCGLANNYSQLFLARVGVGVGAAALTPAAYSLISDLFRPRWLPVAMSVYVMSIAIGSGLAFVIGGAIVSLVRAAAEISVPFIGGLRSWQLAFVLAGLPGLPLAVLMLTVKEPARRGLIRDHALPGSTPPASIPLGDVIAFITRRWRSYGAVIAPAALLTMLSYAFYAWIPAYFVRVHGWTEGQVGLAFGLSILLTGIAATLSGGALCSYLLGRRRTAYLLLPLGASLCLIPLVATATLAGDAMLSLALLAAVNFFSSCWGAPVASGLQALTPNQMRGQVSALYLFCVNIAGLGLGPVTVGAMTDWIFAEPAAVRYSMALTGIVLCPLAALLLVVGLKPFAAAIKAADAWSAA